MTLEGNMDDDSQRVFVDEFQNLQRMLQSLQKHFDKFVQLGQKQQSTFHFWQQYITDVQTALDYTAAEKFLTGINTLNALLKSSAMLFHTTIKIMQGGVQFSSQKCYCYLNLHQ